MLDPSQIAPETLRPLRRTEYERLVEFGAFANERVELLYGMVVQMSPKGIAHDFAIVGTAYTRVTPYRRGEVIALQRFAEVAVPVGDVIR